jgi:molybdopterin synthase catalytic subunit
MREGRSRVVLTGAALDERELTDFVATPASGGVVLFSGVVRNEDDGRSVVGIEYAAAEALARVKLAEVAAEVLRDPEVHRVAVSHRIGELALGEASVMVAASAAHRDAAFRAARCLIDRIKEVVPIWKNERFGDGTSAWAPGYSVTADGALPAAAPGAPDLAGTGGG